MIYKKCEIYIFCFLFCFCFSVLFFFSPAQIKYYIQHIIFACITLSAATATDVAIVVVINVPDTVVAAVSLVTTFFKKVK